MADRTFSRISAIAWREFRYTALTKSFLLGAVAIPVIMLAVLAVLPPLMVSQLKPLEGRVAIIDPTGRFAESFELVIDERQREGIPPELRRGLEELGLGPGSAMIDEDLIAGATSQNAPEVEGFTVVDGTSI